MCYPFLPSIKEGSFVGAERLACRSAHAGIFGGDTGELGGTDFDSDDSGSSSAEDSGGADTGAGVKVTVEELVSICIRPNNFHGDWKYTIRPRG